jgi:hypothetical protein
VQWASNRGISAFDRLWAERRSILGSGQRKIHAAIGSNVFNVVERYIPGTGRQVGDDRNRSATDAWRRVEMIDR